MPTSLLDVPPEILEEILVLCEPEDVARASMTCRNIYVVVYGPIDGTSSPPSSSKRRRKRKALWRELYLNQTLDDLRTCVNCIGIPRQLFSTQTITSTSTNATAMASTTMLGSLGPKVMESGDDIDWEVELKRFVRARRILECPSSLNSERELRRVLRTLLKLVDCTPMVEKKESGKEQRKDGEDLAKNLVWVPVTLREFLDDIEDGIEGLDWLMFPTPSPPSFPDDDSSEIEDGDEYKYGQMSAFFRLLPKKDWGSETVQLHSHLRVLYGLTRSDLTKKKRVQSRAWVYNMQHYSQHNDYGPLHIVRKPRKGRDKSPEEGNPNSLSHRGNGKEEDDKNEEEKDKDEKVYVNWEFMDKIHHVMSFHVVWETVQELIENEVYENDWEEWDSEKFGMRIRDRKPDSRRAKFEYMIYPMSMPLTQVRAKVRSEGGGIPLVEVPAGTLEEGGELPENADWAQIEGDWVVHFCYCDHRDLIEYNKSFNEETGDLDTSLFEDEEFSEVFRRIDVKIKVTRVANDPDHPGRPIIGFIGEMNATSNATMHGVVQLTADNHLKWQYYSRSGGAAMWSSVGIQVGGVGSSYGVLGSWTTVFHEEDDPVGPFWMQKRL